MAGARAPSCPNGSRALVRRTLFREELAYKPAVPMLSASSRTMFWTCGLRLDLALESISFTWQAEQHSHIGLIGAEPYEMGVAKLLTKIEDKASEQCSDL